MKKFLIVLATVAMSFFSMVSNAQNPAQVEKAVKRDLEKRTIEMSLDSAQQVEMKRILTIYHTDRLEARANLEGKELSGRIKEIRKALNAGIATICTQEQIDAWTKYQESLKDGKNKE